VKDSTTDDAVPGVLLVGNRPGSKGWWHANRTGAGGAGCRLILAGALLAIALGLLFYATTVAGDMFHLPFGLEFNEDVALFAIQPLFAVCLILLHLVSWTFRARTGRAALLDTKVVLEHPDVLGLVTGGTAQSVVHWKEVISYREYDDFVQLHTRTYGRWSPSAGLAIPTESGEDKVAVLDLLTERGVTRRD
jgi:hypothetical protein